MRKIIGLLLCAVCLGACASVPRQPSCGTGLLRPAFFAGGEQVAAFRVAAAAHGYGFDGILQIKKTEAETYEVTLFSAAGGYRLLRAEATAQGVQYAFVAPALSRRALRHKAERLLQLLLFAPDTFTGCRQQKGRTVLTYKGRFTARYEYDKGQRVAAAVSYQKFLASARLQLGGYEVYETGAVPQQLYFQDGAATAELVLLTHKK